MLACVGRPAEPPTPRALLVHSVYGAVRANPYHRSSARYVADSLRVMTRSSEVVPGLVYYWGLFTPPGTADVSPFTALAATAAGQVKLLSHLSDWVAMVNSLRWVPLTSRQAVAACSELVQTVGPRADPINIAIYTDSLRLRHFPPFISGLDSLATIAKPPTVDSAFAGWDVRLWAVEEGRAARYGCRLGKAAGGLSAELATLDSLPGLGIVTGP